MGNISMTKCVWRAIFALSLCTIASGASESFPSAMHESSANPKAKINVLQEIVRDTEQTSRGAPDPTVEMAPFDDTAIDVQSSTDEASSGAAARWHRHRPHRWHHHRHWHHRHHPHFHVPHFHVPHRHHIHVPHIHVKNVLKDALNWYNAWTPTPGDCKPGKRGCICVGPPTNPFCCRPDQTLRRFSWEYYVWSWITKNLFKSLQLRTFFKEVYDIYKCYMNKRIKWEIKHKTRAYLNGCLKKAKTDTKKKEKCRKHAKWMKEKLLAITNLKVPTMEEFANQAKPAILKHVPKIVRGITKKLFDLISIPVGEVAADVQSHEHGRPLAAHRTVESNTADQPTSLSAETDLQSLLHEAAQDTDSATAGWDCG